MTALFLLFVLGCFIVLSFQAPFIAALAYVWADIADPQKSGYGFIRTMPLSMITASFAFILYFLTDRKYPPKLNITMFCLILFALWVTFTTFWAVLPDAAWHKWESAIKVLLFASLMPLFFRTRVQIEAVLLVFNFSLLNYFLPRAVKFVLGQAVYNMGDAGNSGLNETSTIALVCAMLIPLNLYFAKYSVIFTNPLIRRPLFYGIALLCPLAILNTFARTGLVALGVFGLIRFFQSRKKFQYILFAFLFTIPFLFIAPDSWFGRMNTIQTFESDYSAMTRIAVWAGTIDYVSQHPWGGGFGAYRDQSGVYFDINIAGRAYHNSFIEVLGEHGYAGIILFAIIHLSTLASLRRMIKLTGNDESQLSLHELLKTLFIMHIVYLAGSNFIGIAFQSSSYYVIAITMCLANYVSRIYVAPARAAPVHAYLR